MHCAIHIEPVEQCAVQPALLCKVGLTEQLILELGQEALQGSHPYLLHTMTCTQHIAPSLHKLSLHLVSLHQVSLDPRPKLRKICNNIIYYAISIHILSYYACIHRDALLKEDIKRIEALKNLHGIVGWQ